MAVRRLNHVVLYVKGTEAGTGQGALALTRRVRETIAARSLRCPSEP
jgi:hypothetical protein